MTGHSSLRNRIIRDRRGYSALIGTIIMILVVMFLFYNVYMFSLSRDADYQNIVSRSQQLDADRDAEKLTIQTATITGGGAFPFFIKCTLQNSGSVPIQVVRLWFKDLSATPAIVASLSVLSQNVVLQPGSLSNQTFTVTLSGALPTDFFSVTLISSRANPTTRGVYGTGF